MLEAFANTFKIPELRKRILFTLGLVFIYRLISMIPTPGVDWSVLQKALEVARQNAGGDGNGGLMGMVTLFTGGALARCSVGTLGIWPYISASIVLQMMTAIIPALERMSRDGESGRQKINQWTRYLTIGICVVQSFFIAHWLVVNPARLMLPVGAGEKLVAIAPAAFYLLTVVAMTSAAMLSMWLGDQITARGIGNGISLLIMINICSRLPFACIEAWERYFSRFGAHKSVFEFVLLLLVGFLVCVGTVMLNEGVRKVPIHTARRTVGASVYGGQATYMPLRVNFSGVMPIIFAGPLLQIPGSLLKNITKPGPGISGALNWFGTQLAEGVNATYIVLFSLLVLFFSFFWVATQFNAMRIADDFKLNGSYVPGIRPGLATAEFLDHTMSRVTLIGAIGLIIVAIFPTLLRSYLNLPWEMASFFGGTSLLIIVGVALDTLRQMESHLLMRHYDGFLKHGRIESRRG